MTTGQTTMALMNTLDDAHKAYKTFVYLNYLDPEEIPLFMREFYSESPSWFLNQDIRDMKETIQWSSLDENEKLEHLNDDLADYFNH